MAPVIGARPTLDFRNGRRGKVADGGIEDRSWVGLLPDRFAFLAWFAARAPHVRLAGRLKPALDPGSDFSAAAWTVLSARRRRLERPETSGSARASFSASAAKTQSMNTLTIGAERTSLRQAT